MRKMNKKGFTLVELMVVLAILGLLAGIGIPQYMNTLERSREAADNAIIATVQSAVDGFLAETGAEISKLRKAESDELDAAATFPSILTGDPIILDEFLDPSHKDTEGEVTLPPSSVFKSKKYKDASGFKWTIDDKGKVTVDTE